MPTFEPIRVEGLAAIRRGLQQIGSDAPKALRVAANEAADIVVQAARRDVPRRSGKAAASIRAASTQTKTRVKSGGRRAPYMPWLDYGGKVGRNDTAARRFIADGRYVYPAYHANKDRFEEVLLKAIRKVAEDAGLEVT